MKVLPDCPKCGEHIELGDLLEAMLGAIPAYEAKLSAIARLAHRSLKSLEAQDWRSALEELERFALPQATSSS